MKLLERERPLDILVWSPIRKTRLFRVMLRLAPIPVPFDSVATQVLDGKIIKTLGWFDNGWGYAHRAVELMSHIAKVGGIV